MDDYFIIERNFCACVALLPTIIKIMRNKVKDWMYQGRGGNLPVNGRLRITPSLYDTHVCLYGYQVKIICVPAASPHCKPHGQEVNAALIYFLI